MMKRLAVGLFLCLVTMFGCKEGAAPVRLTITADAGASQTGTAGLVAAVQPAVRVTGEGGAGVAGITVVFAVESGGGAVAGATQTTDANGRAAVGTWTLGQVAGVNTLSASVDGREVTGEPVTFTATAGAGAAAVLEKQTGDGQSATVATAVPTAPSVRAADAFGNPVANVMVNFAATAGGGTVVSGSQATGANGVAAVGQWLLGNIVGANTLTATATGATLAGSPAVFNATGVAAAPASVTALAGDNQTAPVSTALQVSPRIRANDAFGNNVPGVPVEFTVTQGGGSATGTSQTTSGDGTAAVGSWILGAVAGLNQLTATVQGTGVTGNPIVFNATAAALFNASRYAGTWTGTWINNTFQSVGTNTLTITVDESAMTVTIAFSTTGSALGVPGGVPEQSNMTAYDDTGFTATVALNVYGTTTLTIDSDGNVTASGVNIPQSGFDRWDATGTITDTQLILDWTVTFTGGGMAAGRTTLTKQ